MATTKVCMGQVVGADGVGRRARVTITLSAPAMAGTQEVLTAPIVVPTNESGVYSVNLFSNADLTPATTTYQVSEADQAGGGTYTFKITVPQTAGPFQVAAITTP